MTVQSYKTGPGVLLLGSTPLDVSAQVTSCTLTPAEQVAATDAIPVLSGEELEAEEERTFTFVLSGNLLQDLTANAVVDWTWDHMGEEQPFVFIPNTAADRGVDGTCYIVPLAIGGDVKTTARSDFSFRVKGTPTFGDYDAVTQDVTPDV